MAEREGRPQGLIINLLLFPTSKIPLLKTKGKSSAFPTFRQAARPGPVTRARWLFPRRPAGTQVTAKRVSIPSSLPSGVGSG